MFAWLGPLLILIDSVTDKDGKEESDGAGHPAEVSVMPIATVGHTDRNSERGEKEEGTSHAPEDTTGYSRSLLGVFDGIEKHCHLVIKLLQRFFLAFVAPLCRLSPAGWRAGTCCKRSWPLATAHSSL